MHKIVIRDMRNNNVEIYDFKVSKAKNQTKLMALDEFLSKYKYKDEFINSIMSVENSSYYDVYVVYNSGGGYKTLDAYFGKNVSNEDYKGKMIDNIVNNGLKQEEFINYLRQNAIKFYQNFDHYKGKLFEYNNLKRYIDCIKMGDYSSSEKYKQSIKDKLENDYNKLRKMVDYAYRFKNKKAGIHDDARKMVDYEDAFSKIIVTSSGQVNLFNYFKIQNSADSISKEALGKEVLFSESLNNKLKENVEGKNILDLYFELLDRDEAFIDVVYESDIPKYLKDLSYRYTKSLLIDNDDILEIEYQKNIIRTKLSGKTNLKKVTEMVKKYLTNTNSKTL